MEVENPGPIDEESEDRRREEGHFRSLFSVVVKLFATKNEITEEELDDATAAIINSFKYSEGGNYWDVKYTVPKNVCAYMRRFGPLGAGLTRYRVLQAAPDCKALMRLVCASKEEGPLRVVNLGSGHGGDVLGFCSALWRLGFRDRDLLLTMVDSVEGWSDCIGHAERLAKEGDYGDVSEMFQRDQVKLKFKRANLPVYKEPCLDALRDADVVLMVRLLSIIDWDDKEALVQNIYLNMKDGALLLFIDSPFRQDLWQRFNFEILYGPVEDETPYELLHPKPELGSFSKAFIVVLRKNQVGTDSKPN